MVVGGSRPVRFAPAVERGSQTLLPTLTNGGDRRGAAPPEGAAPAFVGARQRAAADGAMRAATEGRRQQQVRERAERIRARAAERAQTTSARGPRARRRRSEGSNRPPRKPKAQARRSAPAEPGKGGAARSARAVTAPAHVPEQDPEPGHEAPAQPPAATAGGYRLMAGAAAMAAARAGWKKPDAKAPSPAKAAPAGAVFSSRADYRRHRAAAAAQPAGDADEAIAGPNGEEPEQGQEEPEEPEQEAPRTVTVALAEALRDVAQCEDAALFVRPPPKRWQSLLSNPVTLGTVCTGLADGAYPTDSLDAVARDLRQVWENARNYFAEPSRPECRSAAVCSERCEAALAAAAEEFAVPFPPPPSVSLGGNSLLQCHQCAVKEAGPRTGLVFDEQMLRHRDMSDRKKQQPERPQRIARVFRQLCKSGLVERCQRVPSRPATKAELQAVHTTQLIEQIDLLGGMKKQARKKAAAEMDETNSLYFNESSADCAYLAAGSVSELTQRVLEGEVANGVAIVRPPGHHATCTCSMGFCVFNNVAVAARAAVSQGWGGAKKVVIIDWDVHHGNGTQQMFAGDTSILYISIHRYDDGEFFPCGTKGH